MRSYVSVPGSASLSFWCWGSSRSVTTTEIDLYSMVENGMWNIPFLLITQMVLGMIDGWISSRGDAKIAEWERRDWTVLWNDGPRMIQIRSDLRGDDGPQRTRMWRVFTDAIEWWSLEGRIVSCTCNN